MSDSPPQPPAAELIAMLLQAKAPTLILSEKMMDLMKEDPTTINKIAAAVPLASVFVLPADILGGDYAIGAFDAEDPETLEQYETWLKTAPNSEIMNIKTIAESILPLQP